MKLAEFDKLAEELYADDVIAQMREGRFTLEGAEEDDVGAPVNRPHVRRALFSFGNFSRNDA